MQNCKIALGAHDKNLTIYGSQFNMNISYKTGIFNQLRDNLVNNGKMAVIQYDKRSCKSAEVIGFNGNLSDYLGPEPICDPPSSTYNSPQPWCINCNIMSHPEYKDICYNDTNITINDIILDAQRAMKQGLDVIIENIDSNIVDLNQIWTIPIGYSAQGASIASYIASNYHGGVSKWETTVISLMGAGVNIDQLLINQLEKRMINNNITDTEEIKAATMGLQNKFISIEDGSLGVHDMVDIDNDFLTDLKHVNYWKDWLDLNEGVNYWRLDNFLAINSFGDDVIDYDDFKGLNDIVFEYENMSVNMENYYLRDINHYLIDKQDFENGEWKIDDKISEQIIGFLNDINGYLDNIENWIVLNRTNNTLNDVELVENDTIYKVLLYMMIMLIVFVLSLGIYCVAAKKVCPYEFMDADQLHEDDQADERRRAQREERRRRRRRRHRERERRRRRQRSGGSSGNHNNIGINGNELNEPMIQRVESVLEDNGNSVEMENIMGDRNNGNGVMNGGSGNELIYSTATTSATQSNSLLNEYVD